MGELGAPKYPIASIAKALVAFAKDHFEFVTAEEQGFTRIEQRVRAMEDMLRQLQSSLVRSDFSAPAGCAGRGAAAQPGRRAGLERQDSQPGCRTQGLQTPLGRQCLNSPRLWAT